MNPTTSLPSAHAPSKRKIFILLAIFLLLVSGGIFLHFYRLHQADHSPTAEQAPWAVSTGEVLRSSVSGIIQTVATIEAPNIINLSPQIQGTVIAIGPRAGVAVRRGELLVRIDARSITRNIAALMQQRAAAQADAEYAAKQQARIDAVLAEGGVSQAQADQARTAAAGARAKAQSLADEISALRVTLGYAEIRAPQNAVVSQRLVEVGDTVGPGKLLYQLTAGRGAVARVSLPADQLAQVKVGDTLRLTQGGTELNLSVTRVAPAVNAAGLGTVEADARTAPFGLPSGSTLSATVLIEQYGRQLTVPISALVGEKDNAHVVLFTPAARSGEPGRLRLIPVKVLQKGSERAAIQGAIEPGQQVVVGQTAVLAQLRNDDAAVTSTSMETRQ